MKFFTDMKPRQTELYEQPKVKSFDFIMEKLMLNCTKTGEVREAVWSWLMSLSNPMSKKMFEDNMRRLSHNDDEALEQLFNSQGYMKVKLAKPPQKPPLPKDLLEAAVEQKRVAIGGAGIPKQIGSLVKKLKELDIQYYVLDVEELIIQYVMVDGKLQQNLAPQMIKKAVEADLLIMVKFETCPMLEWVVKEALRRIHRLRKAQDKICISTWHRFNNVPDVFEDYYIYSTRK